MEVFLIVGGISAYIAFMVHQSGQARQAAQPVSVRLRQQAPNLVDEIFGGAGFTRSGDWDEDDDRLSAFFRPTSGWKTLNADYGVRAQLLGNQLQATLANDGVYNRSYLFGIIPAGPKTPIGASHFAKLKRALEDRG